MTRSMRSRFRDEPPPPPRPEPEEDKEKGRPLLTLFGNLLVLVLIVGLGALAISWIMNDISGEYYGRDRQLGYVRMGIMRKATSLVGDINYGTGAPLVMTHGEIRNGTDLDLSFEVPQKWVQEGKPYRAVNFKGKLEGSTIKGILEDSGINFEVTLTRSALNSLFRQLQSHMPWTG